MPKKIDHEERKVKILQTALKVFAREGYRDSNLSLIAAECGISRPTIYQYFKDKEQIYYYAVKLVTGRMFAKYADYAWNTEDPILIRITAICNDIVDMAKQYRNELTSLMDVMLQLKKEGMDFSDIIFRRTAKLHILFKRLLRIGISTGEVVFCDIAKITQHLVILLESFCFQLAFLDAFDAVGAKEVVSNYMTLLDPNNKGHLI
ncbi:MAG: TetR/AcrR family transcriptional regulator [Sphaerochaetaceae bacterium]|jgi:AcrR family transcriptional regulator|nr:TetR/AcrR family transcriptional regulator [Sphaerochaetaceae bacterium]NLO59786.1 TetR/AcrR family transcriptional regulator [Spirochaetales bacterium]MDD2405568.1 TetR/AcrR family transcriptional regulator [Sphaerochaetaceae bacterium]MDD3669813.1 TetR/AcrR family transcriptional regulator [Sphaerochaetaceae bacterium]MDD4258863.1 TetR/AcrR family transcriptional regulator [Sphaerochaetaceae bacterium]